MKRTLLNDLEKVYNSLKCNDLHGSRIKSCRHCKNINICFSTHDLISMIRKFY